MEDRRSHLRLQKAISAARGIWSRRAAAALRFIILLLLLLLLMMMLLLMIVLYISCGIDEEAISSEVSILRIEFERTGGFAGITLSATVDADDLNAGEADELRRLVKEVDFFNLPAVIAPHKPHPDRFQYEVTVQDDGRMHTVRVSEEVMPEALRPLIKWLSEKARQGRKGEGNR